MRIFSLSNSLLGCRGSTSGGTPCRELRQSLLALRIQVLVEQRCVHKSLVQFFALVNFAEHELPAESVVFVERLEELFFVEGLKQLGVVRIDTPMLTETL